MKRFIWQEFAVTHGMCLWLLGCKIGVFYCSDTFWSNSSEAVGTEVVLSRLNAYDHFSRFASAIIYSAINNSCRIS